MVNHDLEVMKKIKEDIDKLTQKITQFQGAVNTLRSQEKDMDLKFQQEYKLETKDISSYLEKENNHIEEEKVKIINSFNRLYENEHLHKLIKIIPPFTVEAIYNEIQNNLLPLKSQAEGELNSLEKQQEELAKTLKNEFNLELSEVEEFLLNSNNELSQLEKQIQESYNAILSDDELKTLLR